MEKGKKMNRWKYCAAVASVCAAAFFCTPAAVLAAGEETDGISYGEVASEDEKVTPEEVGVEGMKPVYGTDVADGVYEVETESSSSMFRIEHAVLTVQDGKMTAVLTLGGTGYLKLYMGTGEEAAKADASSYIGYAEDENGAYTYTIPVDALDQPLNCAAFSKKKEKWYDRKILFRAESLPEEAVLVELPDYEELKRAAREKRIEEMKEEREGDKVPEEDQKASDDILPADGTYTIEVALEGGSGRASVQSPAIVTVTDQKAVLTVEWSSSHYDYMLVGEEKYLPVSTEGNAVFEIPAAVLDGSISVTADTTAMSTPHEIDYTLILSGDTLQRTEAEGSSRDSGRGSMLLGILALCVSASGIVKKKLG